MADSAPADEFARGAVLPPRRWDTPASLSDTVYLDSMGFAIRSAAAGTLAVKCADDVIHLMKFTAGETRPVRVVQVRSTSTTGITAADLEIAYQD